MTTRTFISTVTRLLMAAAISVSSAACGGELLRTGRAPVYLVVTQVEAQQGSGTFFSFLLSDVRLREGGAFNDNVRLSLKVEPKNTTIATTSMNQVTMTGYRVDYRRSDGQNRPGIDVPYGISGGLTSTISPGATTTVSFEVVRHQMKYEPPLANLTRFGGLGFLNVVADITVYGRDQNGNEVSAQAFLDISFADFADEDEQ